MKLMIKWNIIWFWLAISASAHEDAPVDVEVIQDVPNAPADGKVCVLNVSADSDDHKTNFSGQPMDQRNWSMG